jgi:hypothetical protein
MKLLKADFQVLQAYNYLRAWDVMKTFDENKAAGNGKNSAMNE